MTISRTVCEINGDFSRKSQNFPHPRVFNAPTEGFPLGIGYRRWGPKTRIIWGDRAVKFDDIFSRLNTIHKLEGQTDGRTPDDSKDRTDA